MRRIRRWLAAASVAGGATVPGRCRDNRLAGPATRVMGPCLLSCVLACGCQTQAVVREALGMRGEYLLYGFDALTTPGHPAEVAVRLQKGSYLRDQEGRLVELHHEGELVALDRTDDEGYARMSFTPSQVGDFQLMATVPAGQLEGPGPEPAEVLVACRAPDETFIVVDIDKTLVASSFAAFLQGEAEPMPHSVQVMHRLTDDRTVLYLTLRPDYFGPRTRQWLADQGYPTGPLWVSRFHGLLQGNLDYRAKRLRRLRQRYPDVPTGIGDKVSDAEAYLANEMTAILVVQVDSFDEAEACLEEAEALERLPASTQVVQDWREIESVLVNGAEYPPDRTVEALRARAKQLKHQD